ncbi:MAG: tetratricopeptide repeat protein [Gemmatimonadota bacterium]
MSPFRKLLEEVHRRSLWQTVGAFAVAAWFILQVIDQLVQQLMLPSRAYRLALLLILIGLPVVLVTAFLQEGLRARTEARVGGLRSVFTWRNVLFGGVIALALWGAFSAVWLMSGSRPDVDARGASDTSPAVIAVLPFSVQGAEDLAYLGSGMVNLLSTKLDGAGDLRSVNPRAVLGRLEREGEPIDLSQSRLVAAGLGAGRYVVGNILEAGGQLQINASLYDVHDDSKPLGTSAATGSDQQIFELVDQIAADLLTQFTGGPGARVRQIARVTTSSLPAFKAYLEGENAFRRGQFEAAVNAFQRATQLDTLYALSYYRLSVAAEWQTRTRLAQTAAEDALAHSTRLSERDRLLLEAHVAWRRGAYAEAESRYRSFVGAYPDDIEAWFQLGEVLFHANPLRGQPFTIARGPFERVVSYEPDHTPALLHLARIAARERQLDELKSLVDAVLTLSPGGDREAELRALSAFAGSSEDEQAQFATWVSREDDVSVAEAAWDVSSYNQSLPGLYQTAGVLTELSRAPEVRALGHMWRALALIGLGRWAEAQAELDAVQPLDPGQALEFRVLFALLPYAPVETAELRRLRDRLLGLDFDSLPASVNPSFFFTAHDDIHEVIRAYQLGVLAARLGEYDEALEHGSALERIETPSDVGTLATDLAQEVRAEVLRAQGRPAEALAELDKARVEIFYHRTMVSPFVGVVSQRFLRAELLRELGRHEEALVWYENLVQVNPGEVAYLPIVHLRRAELYEELGDSEAAAVQYADFLRLWTDADDRFESHLRGAQERFAAIEQERR